MRKRNQVVILLILTAFCLAATANAELAITEIMSQSAHDLPTDCDWWELTNTGPSSVDLTGYSWDDDHQRPGQNVFASITISAGESIIIRDTVTAPGDPWKDDWGLGAEVKVYDPGYFSGGFSGLGSSDGVFLYDEGDVPVTSATYPSRTTGFSNEWAADGTSLGFSVGGENGAYLSANASPDVASPGSAVQNEPCGSSGRMLYWTDKDTAKIQRMNLDSGCVEDILTSADGLLNPRGLAIDVADEKMYWADSVTGVIHRAGLDGSGDVQLVTGLSFPADIALDCGSGKIYFAETGLSKIRRVNLGGSGPIEDVVTGLGEPYYIELDLTNSRIYWSDVDSPVIHRANLDGTGAEDFITGLSRVRDIVVDLPGGKIYWGDRESSKIQRANLDGTGEVEDLFGLADGLDRPHGLLLVAAEDKIYWTDTVTSAVHRGNTDGSGSVEDLATGLNGPWALAIVMVQEVKYVDADAAGANDGSSWEDAFNCLQDALFAARLGDEIWVAQGVYRPDEDIDNPNGTGDRSTTFGLKNGVVVKGGYAGYGEPDPDKRDIEGYETVLSGDLDGNDVDVDDPCDLLTEPTRSENSYHVITNSNIDETAVLDGFTITAGNTNGSPDDEHDRGGGMFNNGHDNQCNPTVTACTFVGNSAAEFGGGMFNYGHGDGESNPILRNCTFLHNAARYEGGGICSWASQAVVTNCTFTGNFAGSGGTGGGMDNIGSSPVLRNCTFSDNVAGYAGGGMSNWEYSTPSLTNCIFRANSAGSGGGMHNGSASDATLTNCTFTGNIAANNGGAIQDYYGSSPTLTNCAFSGNSAGSEGGAMYNDRNSDAILINCTLSDNSAQSNGGGMCSHFDTSPTLTSCILWGNDDSGGVDESAQIHGGTVAVTYSCIQGLDGFTGNQNIGDDPLFRDADGPDNVAGTSDDTLRLMQASPCIDNGDNDAIPLDVETDLDDSPRILDGDCNHSDIVDMGAYEFNYAYMGDFDYDCDVDFRDFAILALAWLTEPGDGQWNPNCDIGILNDSAINMPDLQVFVENWLVDVR
jgi:low-density lipoprotein receptor class B/polymorphic membrane protein